MTAGTAVDPFASGPREGLEQALTLLRGGRLADADALCRALVARFPALADAHHLHGLVALGAKRAEEAAPRLSRAVALAPGVARFHTNLGTAQHGGGNSGAAERSYRRALRTGPDQAETAFNLANLLNLTGRPTEAEPRYRHALALQPGRGKYWSGLGNLLLHLRREAEAVRAYARAEAVAGAPLIDDAVNEGMAHQRLNRIPQALACYDRVLARKPQDAAAHWNRALALLVSGRLAEGWEEYEWRWRLPDCPPRAFAQPLWTGEPLEGATLLLHAEQGLGDTLQLVRYLPWLATMGGRLVLECQPPLRRLLAASFPDVTVVAAGDPLPGFDRHLPLLGLPRVAGTSLADIPASLPYLRISPDEGSPAHPLPGRPFPPPRPGTLAAGLVWGGDPAHRNDRQRSLARAALSALLDIPGVTFHSLQKGARTAELAGLDPDGRVVELGSGFADFADTAAALQGLDVLVTVDTSVAHLAGALGRPVCLMLPHSPDWRWLLDRSDSPWYPSATLFRQTAPGDWSGVIRAVAAHLATLTPPATALSGRPSP